MKKQTRAVVIALMSLGGVAVCLIILAANFDLGVQQAWERVGAKILGPTPVASYSLLRKAQGRPDPHVRRTSPDGRWLYVKAWPSGNDELIEWQTGRRIILEMAHRELCEFSPDAKFIAALQDQKLRIWDLDKDTEQWAPHQGQNTWGSIYFAPDGRHIAVFPGSDRNPFLQIWDTQSATLYASFWMTDLFGHRGTGYVSNVAWGADRTLFVDKYRSENLTNKSQAEQLVCWDVPKKDARFRIDNLVTGDWGQPNWRLSPDGKLCVAIAMEKPNDVLVMPHPLKPKHELLVPRKPLIQAWDVMAGKLLWQRPLAQERAFFQLSFTPDGKKVLVSHGDAKNLRTEAQIWTIADADAKTLLEAEHLGYSSGFVLTTSGRYLQNHERPWIGNTDWPRAGDGKRTVGGWWEIGADKARPAILFDDAGSWTDPDGKTHELFPAEERTKKEFDRRVNLRSAGGEDGIVAPGVAASLSPDERWLAIRVHRLGPPKTTEGGLSRMVYQDSDFELRLVDLRDGSESPFLHDVEHFRFTPDSKHLITTGKDKLQVWALPLTMTAAQLPVKNPPPAPKLVRPAPPANPAQAGAKAPPIQRIADRMLWICYLELTKPNVPREHIVKLLNQSWSTDKEVEIAEKMLLKMVKEDEEHAKKPHADPIAELVFNLRDQTCIRLPDQMLHSDIRTGFYDILYDRNSPAAQLLAKGYDAVPDLIAAIEDDRFTRAVAIPADGALDPYVLRVGDCALTIIERIAARRFRDRDFLSLHRNGDPAKIKKIVADWWDEFKLKGEKPMLIQGVLKGDLNSGAQATALLEKYPAEAIPTISKGIKNQLYQNERPLMFHIVTDRFLPGKAKELPPEVRDFCRAFLDDDYRFAGNLQLHAINVLGQHGDERATKLLLADWERRREAFRGEKYPEDPEAIPAMLRCKDGAALPALLKGWPAYPRQVRFSVLHYVHEMLSEPGYVVATAEHRRLLGQLLVELLDDREPFTGEKWLRRGKVLFPYERKCDRAAEIRVPGLAKQPEFNAEAPRAERDQVIAQMRSLWLNFAKQAK